MFISNVEKLSVATEDTVTCVAETRPEDCIFLVHYYEPSAYVATTSAVLSETLAMLKFSEKLPFKK